MSKTWYLWNPLSHTVKKQFHLENELSTYILSPEKITEFTSERVFLHMRSYLVDEILNERNIVHYDHNREAVEKEVTKQL